jgi:hypothetical protein
MLEMPRRRETQAMTDEKTRAAFEPTSDDEGAFRREFARRYQLRFPKFEQTPSGIESIMACGEAKIARGWFMVGMQAALQSRTQLGEEEIAEIITNMRRDYASDACVTLEVQGIEIARALLAAMNKGEV